MTTEARVRAIARQWAWKIKEDGATLPPDMLRFTLVEVARALDELVEQMDTPS